MNKMLIIDNEPVFVDSVKAVFKANSYSVVIAESGTEACLKKNGWREDFCCHVGVKMKN